MFFIFLKNFLAIIFLKFPQHFITRRFNLKRNFYEMTSQISLTGRNSPLEMRGLIHVRQMFGNAKFYIQNFYIQLAVLGNLRFAQKCILGEWLYNVTKGICRVFSVSKSSIGCWKVCGNDCLRRSVQSGHMVAEVDVKSLSAIICLMKWGALQFPILSPNILQC